MATDAPAAPLPGVYQGELPAAGGPGMIVTLTLQEDGTADMRTDFQNGQPPVARRGTWTPLEADRPRVRFTETDGSPAEETITFQLRGATLRAVAYDRSRYGSEGLVLERR